MTTITRSIRTVYYFKKGGRGGEKGVAKINRALHAKSAVLHCIEHMQNNKYEAVAAEVFNEDDGTLYAVVRRTMTGIEILYNSMSTPDMLSYYLAKKGAK